MPIVTIKQKTALYLGNKIHAPQKSFVDTGAAAVRAKFGCTVVLITVAVAYAQLVTLTCTHQQHTLPTLTSHSYSLQMLFACSAFSLQSSLRKSGFDVCTVPFLVFRFALAAPRWAPGMF